MTSDRMYALAARILRDNVLAEDALQGALITVWRQLPTLRDPDRFEAWVRRLLVHACYAEARRRRSWAANVRVLPVDGPAAPDGLLSIDDRDALDRAFRRLTVEQRAVFVLHHHVGPATDRDRRHARHPGRHGPLATPLCDPGAARGRRGRRGAGRPRRTDGMTTERDFDRLARAWLELGPDEAPDRVIAAVLQAAETTPQVRRPLRWPIWRSFHMTRLPIAAAAAAHRRRRRRRHHPHERGQPAHRRPSRDPVAYGGDDRIRRADRGRPACVPRRPMERASPRCAVARLEYADAPVVHELDLRAQRRQLSERGDGGIGLIDADGHLRLTSTNGSASCAIGDVGTYPFTVSPGGKILTIGAGQDACAARAVAMAGTWYSSTDCKTDPTGCYGTLEAGTFPSQYVGPRVKPGESWSPPFGAVTYTVPDGWVNSADWPAALALTPVADYANQTENGVPDGTWHEIGIRAQPAASVVDKACSDTERTDVPRTVDGLIGAITAAPSVSASTPQAITIDGHAGKWVDVSINPGWTGTCQGADGKPLPVRATNILTQSNADSATKWDIGLEGPEKTRLIVARPWGRRHRPGLPR